METTTILITSVLGSSVLASIVTVIGSIIVKQMDKKKMKLEDLAELVVTHNEETDKSVSLLTDSQKELMRNDIKQICRAKLKDGLISADEMEDLVALYLSYKALGGNGFCDHLMHKVSQLPIK